ncbi:uncharacterized protein LOC128220717 isoform X2 [Mya arenaria]|uniref:uncharacterized protein LOC128220717 isoform X2 n=1 Tax=Mya arenaria TaxID=6604 RepID=UPI0022E2BA6A|nr:uncharacterized protein LOC128220717 isoform X2 [Mya arenaria]
MGLSWIFASLLCVLTVDWSQAACDQSMATSEATLNCITGFSTYISQASSSISDPSQMATIFCSAEGQSAIACMYPIMEQCPELMANMGDGAMTMPSQADLQKACTQMPSGPCMKAMTCVASASQGASMGVDENFMATNNLTYLLPVIGMTCGPMKEQFDCITPEVEEQCTEITNQIKQMIPLMNNGMPDGIGFPEYDVLKTLIRTGCTNVPEDIATNKCARDRLESAPFKECMTKANADFKTPMEMKSCGATDARLMCLKESVEKPCGKSYYTALATNGDHFLTMDHFTCDRSTSAAPVVRLSAAASLVALAAVLLL